MRRVTGWFVGAIGTRDAGFVRGRLAHLLPPVVVGLEPSVISPREAERQRWGSALLRPSAHHGEVEGLLMTTTRMQNRARLTCRVDAHIDARNRFVVAGLRERVPSARLRLVVFRPFKILRATLFSVTLLRGASGMQPRVRGGTPRDPQRRGRRPRPRPGRRGGRGCSAEQQDLRRYR